MNAGELIRALREYPSEWEVWLDIKGVEGIIQDVYMESGGASTWVVLTDRYEGGGEP